MFVNNKNKILLNIIYFEGFYLFSFSNQTEEHQLLLHGIVQ